MSSRKTRINLSKILAKSTIHETHDCSWCICETKWYHYKLIVSIPCSEGCLMNIFIFDSYLMVNHTSSLSWKILLLLSFDQRGHQFDVKGIYSSQLLCLAICNQYTTRVCHPSFSQTTLVLPKRTHLS